MVPEGNPTHSSLSPLRLSMAQRSAPKTDCQPLSGVQLGWFGVSTDGEMAWPDW